ncbi:MAG: hypothetical protein AAF518_07885 [Spirochaetota bacterium]
MDHLAKLLQWGMLFLFLQNCATSNAGMAISNVPIVSKKYKVLGVVEKKTSWTTIDIAIIGFPLEQPPIDKVVNDAIAEKEADALINIRYWNDKMIFGPVTLNRFGLKAEAVKFEGGEVPVGTSK